MKVADKWKDLGVQLLPSDQERMLCIIEANHPHDVVSCCKRVFDKWLDVTEDPRWNMLIKALNSPSVQLDYLAGQLEKMLITECKTYMTASFLEYTGVLLHGTFRGVHNKLEIL